MDSFPTHVPGNIVMTKIITDLSAFVLPPAGKKRLAALKTQDGMLFNI